MQTPRLAGKFNWKKLKAWLNSLRNDIATGTPIAGTNVSVSQVIGAGTSINAGKNEAGGGGAIITGALSGKFKWPRLRNWLNSLARDTITNAPRGGSNVTVSQVPGVGTAINITTK
jgi:hypothetical protein